MQRIHNNPYRSWMTGLAFELVVFVSFLVVLALLAVFSAWIR